MSQHDRHQPDTGGDDGTDGFDPYAELGAEFRDYLDPYSAAMSLDDGPDRLIVDVTKFFDSITEQLERADMDNEPIGLPDVANRDVWFSMINSGWSEQICGHLAATAADIVHARYPSAAAMPVDDGQWINLVAEALDPPYEWSYPGAHLEIAKKIMGAYLRGEADDLAGIDYTAGDTGDPFDPLYKTVKSAFELAIAVIGLAKTPLYRN